MAFFSGNQLSVVLRATASPVITAVTLMGGLSLIPEDQVHDFIAALKGFNDSVVTAYGYLTKMVLIIGPVALGVLAKIGFTNSSVAGMIKTLMTLATKPGDGENVNEAKTAIVSAAADPKLGTIAVINPALAPLPVTPPNVVASPEAVQSITKGA